MTKTAFVVLFPALVIQASGCSMHRCACDIGAEAVAAAPSTQDPRSVPVVVRGNSHHDPLSAEQLRSIVERASREDHDGKPIWFIVLQGNRIKDGERNWAVEVYFAPDSETPRMRKGRYTAYNSFRDRIAPLLRAFLEDENPNGTPRARPLPTYVQIAPADDPFHGDLEIPKGACMPFRAPEGFTDEALIAILDFIHSRSQVEYDEMHAGHDQEFDAAAPIRWIGYEDANICVTNVRHETFGSTIGDKMHLTPENGTFRIVKVGMLISCG